MKNQVLEDSIRKAYRQLKNDGIAPTVDKLRSLVKDGTNADIFKVLRTIEEEDFDIIVSSLDPEAQNIVKEFAIPLVKDLYEKCRKRANSIAKAQYKNLAQIDAVLNQKLERLDEIEVQAEYKITAADAIRNEAIAKAELIASKLQTAEQDLKQKETEVATLKKQYEADIATLKQRHEAENVALNKQIKELKQALEQQQQTNKKLDEILTQLQSNIASTAPAKTNSKQNKKAKQEV